jgi:hypothetical protein
MDLYRGLVDPLAPDTHQIHDFNLDIVPFPSGLFWTRKVDAASVSVDPSSFGAGAMMQIQEMHLTDYHTLANSFSDGALSGEEPASVSFALRWSGSGTPDAKNDPFFKFRYAGILNSVSIEWSAKKSDGFRFQSDPASTSVTNYALLATEHNGTFY